MLRYCGLVGRMRQYETEEELNYIFNGIFTLNLLDAKSNEKVLVINCLRKFGPFYSRHLKCKCQQMVFMYFVGKTLIFFSFDF